MESKYDLDKSRKDRFNDCDTLLDEDCAVCLQPCLQPIKLSCDHIFCFLCIKGVTVNHQQHSCPMCRSKIPPGYLDNPDLIYACSSKNILKRTSSNEKTQYKWFHSGAKGWWEYDERTADDIDRSFDVFISQKDKQTPNPKKKKKNKKPSTNTTTDIAMCEILIAGVMYIIDFDNMIQYRKGSPHKKRKIRREIKDQVIDCKGVAGLRKHDKKLDTDKEVKVTEPSSSPTFICNAQQLPLKTNAKVNRKQRGTTLTPRVSK